MKTIKWTPQYGTGQVYSAGVEEALCSANDEQIGPFVFCKDFFQDAVRGYIDKVHASIWGYQYDPKQQPPVDMKNIRILMADSSDNKFATKLDNVVDLLNQVEKKLGLTPTKGYLCNSNPSYPGGVVLLVGDGAWMRSSPTLSLYTLIARNGLNHKIGTPFKTTFDGLVKKTIKAGVANDGMYFEYAMPGIELILKKGIDEVFGKDAAKNYSKVASHALHHRGGIVSFGTGETAKTVEWKHWLQPEKKFSSVPGILFA